MKITGGSLKGRSLLPVRSGEIRPTLSIVREAIFNIRQEVEGARCLDCFCGSGILGFEALSRGAASLLFIDQNLSLVKKNASFLGALEKVSFERGDVLKKMPLLKGPFELIFADPPYFSKKGAAASLAQHFLDLFVSLTLLSTGGTLFLEAKEPLTMENPRFTLKVKKYGKTYLHIVSQVEIF